MIRNRSERYEYTLFGEQIACKIRKLPTEYSRITAQHHINNLLYEAQLENYNYPQDQN